MLGGGVQTILTIVSVLEICERASEMLKVSTNTPSQIGENLSDSQPPLIKKLFSPKLKCFCPAQ
jgi:hypothetical protein